MLAWTLRCAEKILKDLEALGVLGDIKDHVYAIGKCDRCKTVAEPRLSMQWFMAVINAESRRMSIAGGQASGRRGHIVYPGELQDHLPAVMDNIHDWCISASYGGHRIPAWHARIAKTSSRARAGKVQMRHGKLEQKPTSWIHVSSAAAFTTLGCRSNARPGNVLSKLAADYALTFSSSAGPYGHVRLPLHDAPHRPLWPAIRQRPITLRTLFLSRSLSMRWCRCHAAEDLEDKAM